MPHFDWIRPHHWFNRDPAAVTGPEPPEPTESTAGLSNEITRILQDIRLRLDNWSERNDNAPIADVEPTTQPSDSPAQQARTAREHDLQLQQQYTALLSLRHTNELAELSQRHSRELQLLSEQHSTQLTSLYQAIRGMQRGMEPIAYALSTAAPVPASMSARATLSNPSSIYGEYAASLEAVNTPAPAATPAPTDVPPSTTERHLRGIRFRNREDTDNSTMHETTNDSP